MDLLQSLAWLLLVCFSPRFTQSVTIKGHLVGFNKLPVPESRKIFVLQGDVFLDTATTKQDGSFLLKFCTGDSTGNPVDFYAILKNRDTVLLASVDAFRTDGTINGDFFLPVKSKNRPCRKCHQSDRLYSLVYVPKKQMDFEMSSTRYYCSRDKTKF